MMLGGSFLICAINYSELQLGRVRGYAVPYKSVGPLPCRSPNPRPERRHGIDRCNTTCDARVTRRDCPSGIVQCAKRRLHLKLLDKRTGLSS